MARTGGSSNGAKRSKGKRQAAVQAGLIAPEVDEFLGAELGGTFDAHGEPVILDPLTLAADRELRQLALRLWQDHQRRSSKPPRQRLADAGLDPADLWGPGISETLQTCSTQDELERYRLKLRFRADLLEALLAETLAELERANALKHMPSAPANLESNGQKQTPDPRAGA